MSRYAGFVIVSSLVACLGGAVSRVESLIAERQGGIDRGTLFVASANLTDAELAEILDHPRILNLVDLSLHHNALTVASAQRVAASPKLGGLRNLNLSNNPLGDEGIRALAGTPVIAPLRVLSLAGVGATAEGARALATSPHATAIAELDLGFQDIGAAAPLLATPRQTLRLQQAGIDGPTAVALLSTGQVATLVLKENPIGSLAGLDALSPAVGSLDLTACGLTEVAALANAEAPGLRSLDVDYNAFGDPGLHALASAPWLGQVDFLSAMGAEGSPEGRGALRAAWGERPGLTVER